MFQKPAGSQSYQAASEILAIKSGQRTLAQDEDLSEYMASIDWLQSIARNSRARTALCKVRVRFQKPKTMPC